jgi:ribosomal protein S18 acetylase RimI-like enzyme
MKIKIRKAISKDIPGIQEILKEGDDFHAFLLPEHFLLQKEFFPAKELLVWINSNPGKQLFLVAAIESQVVGLIVAKTSPHSGNLSIRKVKAMTIEIVAVKSDYRRLKIGLRLIHEVEKYAKRNKFKRLTLNVFEKNKGAIAFYKKAKFDRLAAKMEKTL